jgi:4-amino-4-deoxy-L-arabinose transferase-like glycosyltransferase
MLDSTALKDSSPSQHSRSIFADFAAAAIVLVCLFCNLGAIGLAGPDEPRYVWIARAMAATHDLITPMLYGQPWFEKPVLYYWAAAMGFLLHLPAEWAARLPSALAALAAAIAIGWLGRRYYETGLHFSRAGGTRPSGFASAGPVAALIFSTSAAGIGFARGAAPDMLFSASITLAMAAAASIFRRTGALRGISTAGESGADSKQRDLMPVALFGAFLGFGVLAKGPAAILLAGGAIALWALATKQVRIAFRVAHPLAIFAFCVVALPWYVACALRNPDFLRVFIFQHNFERYLTPLFQHRQPFWFFLPITLAALLPWTALLWGATQEGARLWREKSWKNSPGFFFACWGLFPVLFFSLSQSKLPSYILPAIPPVALLCSVGAIRAFERSRKDALILGMGLAITFATLCILFVRSMGHYREAFPLPDPNPFLVGALTAVAFLAILSFSSHQNLGATIALCALLIAAAVEFVNLKVLPAAEPAISARPQVQFFQNSLHPDRVFGYKLGRAWQYGLTFYLGHPLAEWTPEDPGPALVLTTPQGFQEIKNDGRFRGTLDQPAEEAGIGVFYVPVFPAPRR